MMEHSIKDERPDLDEVWPIIPDREIAKFLLSRIVDDPQAAQNVWNAVVRPLYDLREVSARWPRGRCPCGAVHPAKAREHPGLKQRGHRMWCRWYTGPLEHRVMDERSGFATGDPIVECTCGQRYYKWDDDDWTRRNACPEMLFIWRGPRPEEKEVTMSTEKEPNGGDDMPILEPQPGRKDDE